jgi:hypothetical protein
MEIEVLERYRILLNLHLVVNSQVTNDHTMTTINNEHNINDH